MLEGHRVEWGVQHRQCQDTGSKSSKCVSILWVTFHPPEKGVLFLKGKANNYFDKRGGMLEAISHSRCPQENTYMSQPPMMKIEWLCVYPCVQVCTSGSHLSYTVFHCAHCVFYFTSK